MFNSITYKSESKVVAVTKEIEKTISPDKVVEMYDKTKEEAEKKILQTFVFDDNTIKGVVVEFEPDYKQRLKNYGIRFTLNGKEHQRIITLKSDASATQTGAYKLLADEVIYAVGVEVMRSFPLPHK